MPFFRIPEIFHKLFPNLIWRITTDAKKVYLTFDDGPIEGPTEFVLQTLDKFQSKATFFCIGDNIRKHPQIFKRIIESGHAIGNHTFNHLSGWSVSTPQYLENVKQCKDQIQQQRQQIYNNSIASDVEYKIQNQLELTDSNLFRPPYGRIKISQARQLSTQYKIIMWDVLTSDYAQSVSSEKCLRGSIKATRLGSIIVFHDSLKAEKNMTFVLPRYIEYFLEKGYSFETLNDKNLPV